MNKHAPAAKKILVALTFAAALATTARAQFTPLTIDTNSFNQDVVIERTAPLSLNDVVTATTDGGTNKGGNVWFEKGYDPQSPNSGVPLAGSTVNNGNHTFTMPPDYHTNNVILIGHHNGGKTPITPNGTLSFTTPAAYQALSFLASAGNGPVTVTWIIHYAGGATDTGTFTVLDWFNAAAPFYYAAGRVSLGGGVQNIGVNATPSLFAFDIAVPNTGVNINSVEFAFALGNNGNPYGTGRAMIFAVAGSNDGGSTYTPIIVSGFNQDGVVEADAPATTGFSAVPQVLTNYVNATMDGGLSKANNCWYEQGYYTNFPSTGIPQAGSTFTSKALSATYTMPPTYATNCAILLAGNNASVSNRTINFTTPTTAGALSFLCACANGATFLQCIVNYSGGASETNYLFVPDWFDRNIPWAFHAFGRVNPNNRTLNNTLPEYVSPFSVKPGGFEFRTVALPTVRLFDAVVPLTVGSTITSVSLSFTNGPASTRVISIFAVSAAPIGQVPPVLGVQGTPTPGQPLNAALNAALPPLVKGWESTNMIVLSVTNIAGTGPVSYQWKRAPRGGGLHDVNYSIDYNTFANVPNGPKIFGADSNIITLTNALVGDSADYLCVASNPYGSVTSLVATVEMLSTNPSVLVGQLAGDIITPIASDSTPTAESLDHVIDQVAQKWLSDGTQFGGACCGGPVPFTGVVGFTVTPVSGSTVVSGMRFYTANDTMQRDPSDYLLEGSNDGSSWSVITGGALRGTLSLPTGRNGTGSTPVNPLTQFLTEVNFANSTGYKMYRVSITNNMDDFGTALMQIAEIQLLGSLVPNPPVWVRQPDPTAVVFAGASPSATVQASGYPPPKFQWYTNLPPSGLTNAVTGASNATVTVANLQLAQSGLTVFATAANIFGTITSTPMVITVTNAPVATYPAAVLADNAIGFWRLNEYPDDGGGNNGVIAHDYRGAHNGYYSNAVINVAGYNPTYDVDTAAQFASQDNLVDGIKDVSFEKATGSSQFSIEAWVLGGNQTSDAGIVTKGYNGILNAGTGTGTEQFVLDCTGGNPRMFRFLVRDAAGNGHFAQSTIVPYDPVHLNAMWHHLVGVCDQANGNVFLYVDGILAGSGTISNNVGILSQGLPVNIGSRRSGGTTPHDNQWVGSIDDVAIYNQALTPTQVRNHYNAGFQPPIITLQPTNQILPENVIATFPTSAYGSGTLGFQWYFSSDGGANFNPAPGQTSSNLVFTTAAAQDQYQFELVATNQYGSSTSAVVTLTVVSGNPSFILDLPGTANYLVGHVIQLHVIAGGTAPFTYGWTTNGVLLSDNYRISGSHTPNLVMAYAAVGDTANFQCWVTNSSATGGSVVCAVTVTAPGSTVVPFNVGGTGWSLNGNATTVPPSAPPPMGLNRLELTSGLGNTARSAFMNAQQPIASFNAAFVYQDVSGAGGADGATFCIQNAGAGAAAVGGGGGAMGYGGISPSAALVINIYDPNTRGIRFQANGALTPPFVNLRPNITFGDNANPVQVNLAYSGTTLTASFRDLITSVTYVTNITADIPGIIGSSTAYIGFTGADGGVASTQVISNFNMFPPSVKLTGVRSGSNLQLTWPSGAGAYLMSTPTLNPPAWINDTSDTFQLVNNGNTAQVLVPIGAGARYYRLQVFP